MYENVGRSRGTDFFRIGEQLTAEERDYWRRTRDFVDDEVLPVATELDHADAYPDKIVERLKELGVFGLTISEQYGGLGESLLTYALVVEELSRGWMSISGIINTHFMVAYLIAAHGTDEQREYFLPRMATGEVRGALSMSEPGLGSDVAAIRTAGLPRSWWRRILASARPGRA